MIVRELLKDGKNLGLSQSIVAKVKEEFGKRLPNQADAKFHMPFSDPSIFSKALASFTSSINKTAIKRKFPGMGAVMVPAYDKTMNFNIDGLDMSYDDVYKMAADGTLLVDDEDDAGGIKMQQVRMLNANMGQYITELTNLKEQIKLEARELVDMNAQRYGQIAQSAGATTTQNAISQSSTGSIIIFQMFDEFRRKDYDRDIDYAKLAFIDGLDVAYNDKINGKRHYLSLDVNSFINSDYSVTVRNTAKEVDKVQQLKQWAFSAAQNGDLEAALAAITGDNVSAISDSIKQFTELKRKHEEAMKQVDQQIQEQANQMKLAEIQAKGEQDRQTLALKAQYDLQLEYAKGDIALLGDQDPNNDAIATANITRLQEETKRAIEQSKVQLEREKIAMDSYNAAADRQVKREQMKNDLKIARANKNKYDK